MVRVYGRSPPHPATFGSGLASVITTKEDARMKVTVWFRRAPGPVQVISVTYRIDSVDVPQAVTMALEQAEKLTTVAVARIDIVFDAR